MKIQGIQLNNGALQSSTTGSVKLPRPPAFGILKEVKPRDYGRYMWGIYNGKKIEVYDAYKYNQFLIYVSENMRFIKSKLIYWVDGVKKVIRAEGK